MYLSLPLGDPPRLISRSFLDVFKFGFKIASFSKPQNPTLGTQKGFKSSQKAVQTLSKTLSKPFQNSAHLANPGNQK